jgi:hypothetical protein
MAKNEVRNGQAEYGVVHVDEERMREARVGVFEERSSADRRRRKADPAVRETKDEGAAPANKSAGSKVISAESTGLARTSRKVRK